MKIVKKHVDVQAVQWDIQPFHTSLTQIPSTYLKFKIMQRMILIYLPTRNKWMPKLNDLYSNKTENDKIFDSQLFNFQYLSAP